MQNQTNNINKQKKRSKIGYKILSLLLIVVMLCGIGIAGYFFYKYKKESNVYDDVSKVAVKDDDKFDPMSPYDSLIVDWNTLISQNSDYVGWIHMGTGASYPIVQGTTNQTYLRTNFYKKHAVGGCVFMDSSNTPDWSDRNTFVYGHNMRDFSTMFSKNQLYKSEDYAKTHPYFFIHVKDGYYTYKIINVIDTQDTSNIFNPYITNEQELMAYMELCRAEALYTDYSEGVTGDSKIVSLSTCTGATGGDERLVIQGVQVAFNPYNAIDTNNAIDTSTSVNNTELQN